MGTFNKRGGVRVPLQIFLNEYVRDQPQRCMSLNLSPNGIYLNRLVQPVQRRTPPVVSLEFELPETSEVVWAKGEVIFDRQDEYFHGSGIHFTGMASLHQRMIRDYVLEKRARQLQQLLGRIRRNRRAPIAN